MQLQATLWKLYKMICEKWHWLPSSKVSAILIQSRCLGFMKGNSAFSYMSKCNLIIFALNLFKHPTIFAPQKKSSANYLQA